MGCQAFAWRFIPGTVRRDEQSTDLTQGWGKALVPAATEISAAGDGYADYHARCRGTNINEQTLLATDYLNHFNKIVMLLELLPDMPDCLDEAQEWRPKSYQEHFLDSTFSDKDLAVSAYDHVPEEYRIPFEDAISGMDQLIEASIGQLARAIEAEDMAIVSSVSQVATEELRSMIDGASTIIHGGSTAMEQDQIDALF